MNRSGKFQYLDLRHNHRMRPERCAGQRRARRKTLSNGGKFDWTRLPAGARSPDILRHTRSRYRAERHEVEARYVEGGITDRQGNATLTRMRAHSAIWGPGWRLRSAAGATRQVE